MVLSGDLDLFETLGIILNQGQKNSPSLFQLKDF